MQTLPIVGSYFRPPAKIVLDHLPIDCPMFLRAEPSNEYDPNAIAVWLDTSAIPESSELETALAGFGTTIAFLQQQEAMHVGYVPREKAAVLRALGFPDAIDVPATFSVSVNGAPRVRFEEADYGA